VLRGETSSAANGATSSGSPKAPDGDAGCRELATLLLGREPLAHLPTEHPPGCQRIDQDALGRDLAAEGLGQVGRTGLAHVGHRVVGLGFAARQCRDDQEPTLAFTQMRKAQPREPRDAEQVEAQPLLPQLFVTGLDGAGDATPRTGDDRVQATESRHGRIDHARRCLGVDQVLVDAGVHPLGEGPTRGATTSGDDGTLLDQGRGDRRADAIGRTGHQYAPAVESEIHAACSLSS